jgi:Flp pilus assembly protein TadG
MRAPGFGGRWHREILADEDGATAVEFAIVAAVFIGLCMAILQFGWALQIRNEMAQAADRAVRHVMLNPDSTDEEFEAQAQAALPGYNPERLQVTAGSSTVNSTEFRTLMLNYELPVSIPLLPRDAVTLTVSRRTPDLSAL